MKADLKKLADSSPASVPSAVIASRKSARLTVVGEWSLLLLRYDDG